MKKVFLHGLDSSSRGTKAKWFRERFSEMLIPDFNGPLDDRMKTLIDVLAGQKNLIIIGSSFGGLMATIFAQLYETRVKKLILLAPAINFPEFDHRDNRKVKLPTYLYIGKQDTVCPPDIVIPIAEEIFTDLKVFLSEDDHLLHETFPKIQWQELLEV